MQAGCSPCGEKVEKGPGKTLLIRVKSVRIVSSQVKSQTLGTGWSSAIKIVS